MINLIKYLVH